MRIRSIKPEFWRSDDIAELPISARLTFIGLWSYVDDNGVGADKLASITADLFAPDLERDPPGTFQRVSGDLQVIAGKGLITRYKVGGKPYLYVNTWSNHQVINKPSIGHKYPLPTSENTHPVETVQTPSGDTPETPLYGAGEQGNRGTGEQGKKRRAINLPEDWTPTDAHQAKAQEKRLDLNREAEAFRLHAETHDRRAVNWNSAFSMWLTKANPPRNNTIPSGRPSEGSWMIPRRAAP